MCPTVRCNAGSSVHHGAIHRPTKTTSQSSSTPPQSAGVFHRLAQVPDAAGMRTALIESPNAVPSPNLHSFTSTLAFHEP